MTDLAFARFRPPAPTPYHRALANVLSRREPKHWTYHAGDAAREAAEDALRLELVRRCYRLERSAHPEAYAVATEIAEAMELGVEVLLHQAEGDNRRGAALYHAEKAAHVVFSGDALQSLDAAELRFTLGHELAHHKLWREADGRFWTARRFLEWTSGEAEPPAAYRETARLEALYTELYADRFGLWAVGDLEPALSALVKMTTGLEDVSGAAYLTHAEAVLSGVPPEEAAAAAGAPRAKRPQADPGAPPPDGYLRAALMAAWAHEPAAAEARARTLLEDAGDLTRLDLLAQERLSDLTRWMLFEFLDEPWRRRDLIRAHARSISPELADSFDQPRAETEDIDRLRAAIAASPEGVQRYLCYLLLDFATVDPQLDDVMLAAALLFAGDFSLDGPFREIAARELKITKTKLNEIEKNAVKLLRTAELSLATIGPGDADPPAASSPTATPPRAEPRSGGRGGAAARGAA